MINRSPEIKGGSPRIAGTGVTVKRIAGWHRQGMPPEQIAAEYGHLTLGQVHAALAYYYTNREENRRRIGSRRGGVRPPSAAAKWKPTALSAIRLYLDEDAGQHGLLAALRFRHVEVTPALTDWA